MSSDTDATLEGVAAAAALAESELDKAVRELNEDASIMNPSSQTTYKVGTLSFSVDTDNPTVNPPYKGTSPRCRLEGRKGTHH
jgi:hypothetical protein